MLECGKKAIRFSPPLIITEAQARAIADAVRRRVPRGARDRRARMSESVGDRQAAHVFYTWSAQASAVPLEIVDGAGVRFTTADGARWWDLGSMIWNAGLGHAHPRMRKALAEAAGRGLLVTPNAAFPAKLRAAELLTEVTPPGLEKTFFCLSGAEANENAVKIARLVTGRKKIVARTRSYHGATLAMLSLSGDPRREPFEPGLPGVVRMADPYCFRCPFGKEPTSCAHECAAGSGDRAAARGARHRRRRDPGGHRRRQRRVRAAAPATGRRSATICDRHGVLLIADEVLSGFGRTGRWFAVDHDGVIARHADDGQGDHGRLRRPAARSSSPTASPATSTSTCWCAA